MSQPLTKRTTDHSDRDSLWAVYILSAATVTPQGDFYGRTNR